jgi:hypothetical protein
VMTPPESSTSAAKDWSWLTTVPPVMRIGCGAARAEKWAASQRQRVALGVRGRVDRREARDAHGGVYAAGVPAARRWAPRTHAQRTAVRLRAHAASRVARRAAAPRAPAWHAALLHPPATPA